jgi:hypothetical protein
MYLDQETGIVLYAASPITKDALNASDVRTAALKRFRRMDMDYRIQHLSPNL